MSKHVPAVLQDIDLGPACSKLSGKRLAFVAALVFEVPSGKGAAEAAGEIAGYTAPDARRLSRDKGISAAVKELMEMRIVLEGPAALDAIKEAMSDPYGKDKVKAANSILDRVLPIRAHLTVENTGSTDRTKETLTHLQHMLDIGVDEAALVREFGQIGLDHYRGLLQQQQSDSAKVIEGEVIEVAEHPKPKPESEPKQIETLDDLL